MPFDACPVASLLCQITFDVFNYAVKQLQNGYDDERKDGRERTMAASFFLV
jgi:hypothetical protein